MPLTVLHPFMPANANAESVNSPTPGMPRREFLQRSAGGLLLSVLATRTATGESVDDITLSSDGFALTLHITNDSPAQLRALRNPTTGFEWCYTGTALEPVLVSASGPQQGWTVQLARETDATDKRRFAFTERHAASALTAQYVLHAVPDAPIAEIQTELHNTGTQPLKGMTTFGAVRFRLRDDLGTLKVHQEGGGVSVVEAIEKNEFLLVGVEWGNSVCRIEEGKDGRWLNVEISGHMGVQGAEPMVHDITPGERFIVPRVFLGGTHGDKTQAFLTARHYLQRHVFPKPRKNWPWVHYNFWGTEGTGVQEALLKEIDLSAELGIELICHDAAWYDGSAKTGKEDDWGVGLGSYLDDRTKYPMGLAAISRKIHEKGMKFGAWIGPNIVDPRTVGPLIKEEWLCKVKGQTLPQTVWGEEHAPLQVCFGSTGYIEHLKKELSGIVERFQLDVLRWDNSGMVGACDRTDHGHQAGDWAYAWLKGEHEVFEHLRAKFPDRVLELCSGPDYGIARSVRAFGGDKRGDLGPVLTANNLSSYPSSYTGAWLVDPSEKSAVELDTMFRGQMAGWFGFGMWNGVLRQRVSLYPPAVLAAARRNIPLYKKFRHLLNEDSYHVLPARPENEASWIAVQFVTPTGNKAVVLAFRQTSTQDTVQLPVQALDAKRTYIVTFANTGQTMHLKGTDMLRDGIRASLPMLGMSDVIMLRAT